MSDSLEPDLSAPPTTADLVDEIAELRAQLDHFEGLVRSLGTRLARHQLIVLESIHKSDVAIDLNRRTAERLGKVEHKLGMAAE